MCREKDVRVGQGVHLLLRGQRFKIDDAELDHVRIGVSVVRVRNVRAISGVCMWMERVIGGV